MIRVDLDVMLARRKMSLTTINYKKHPSVFRWMFFISAAAASAYSSFLSFS